MNSASSSGTTSCSPAWTIPSATLRSVRASSRRRSSSCPACGGIPRSRFCAAAARSPNRPQCSACLPASGAVRCTTRSCRASRNRFAPTCPASRNRRRAATCRSSPMPACRTITEWAPIDGRWKMPGGPAFASPRSAWRSRTRRPVRHALRTSCRRIAEPTGISVRSTIIISGCSTASTPHACRPRIRCITVGCREPCRPISWKRRSANGGDRPRPATARWYGC